tara:strand:+ start:2901 stop:3179 length:279 start_codon:yes stop_codon:yes gene_type:complete
LKKASFLRFYRGAFTSRDVDDMPVDEFEEYWNAINVIESKEIMTQFTVSDFPHYKNGKRKEIYNKLKMSFNQASSRAQSTEEIARMLGALDG